MKFFDDLVKLFTRRPRGRAATLSGEFVTDSHGIPRETGAVYRTPLYIRVFRPGFPEPVLVLPVANIAVSDYAPAKIEGGRLVRDETEAAVYFDCITPPRRAESVHVDTGASHGGEGKAEVKGKALKLREAPPPNSVEAAI